MGTLWASVCGGFNRDRPVATLCGDNVPSDYKLSAEAESLFSQIRLLEFSEQITLFRDIVSPMGIDPNAVEHDPATGL
ncbi:orange carotenoid protein N-terminal domain-containing protein [Stenomitos frigidus]|uniref:orange carotenoid protein N-terminal domain-containing protein n=1 Tax=Stenomitos frigidus TaxID=1886765 RepID=UPI001FEA0B2B|nr:orange carotenoid protein N-terminal domain-containing protein [Stenomitos frigidus]